MDTYIIEMNLVLVVAVLYFNPVGQGVFVLSSQVKFERICCQKKGCISHSTKTMLFLLFVGNYHKQKSISKRKEVKRKNLGVISKLSLMHQF